MSNETFNETFIGFDEFAGKVTYWIEGVGILAVGSVGLIINLVALWILFKKQVLLHLSP